MEDYEQEAPVQGEHGITRIILVVLVVAYALSTLYLLLDLRSRSAELDLRLTGAEQQQMATAERLAQTESRLQASTEALAEKLGVTEKELSARAATLQRQQQAAERRLAEAQEQKISAVTGEIAGVKTEVGGVKTEVATTRTELEATRAKLERTIGDLGLQSGLIARTREDLEELKRRGERNYFEFTLRRKQRPLPVGTISLELKKVDRKKGKYTLNVLADDRKIEKKDKNLNEPVQFYSGRDRQLFELVVFTLEKDTVSGYLSTPKVAVARQ